MIDHNSSEQQELFELEQIIWREEREVEALENAKKVHWVTQGQALRKIQQIFARARQNDGKPFGFESFKDYCESDHLPFGYGRAKHLIEAEDVVRNLEQPHQQKKDTQVSFFTPPADPQSLVPLYKLTPTQQREVVHRYEEKYPEKPLTPQRVRETRNEMYPQYKPVYRWQESLDEVFNLAAMLVQNIEREGGISKVWQGWTQDRQQDFLERVAEIEGIWTVFAAEVQGAFPKSSMTILKG